MPNITEKLPVAVTIKPVLAMIVAFTENDSNKFKENALIIAKELELNNENDLALYIYAQFGLVSTFNIND